jgi:hypothetical protein
MLQNLQTEKTKTTSSFFKIKIRVFPNFENDATMQVASSISQILLHTHTRICKHSAGWEISWNWAVFSKPEYSNALSFPKKEKQI